MDEVIGVQRLRPSDEDLACQVILAIKWEAESNEAASLDSAAMRRWLADPDHVLIAATTGGHVGVGFALGYLLDRVDQPRPMLCFYEIVVASDYRRRGIGKQLVEAMKAVAAESNALKMWVQTDPDNHPARRLYQRAGGIESTSPDCVYSWSEGTFSDKHISSH